MGFRNNRVVSTFIYPGFRILAVSIPQDINPYLKTFALNPNPENQNLDLLLSRRLQAFWAGITVEGQS